MFKVFSKFHLSRQNLILGLILIGVFIAGFTATYLILTYTKAFVKTPSAPKENAFSKVTPAPVNEVNPQKGVYNVLLLGYGGAGHSGSLLTDSIIVVHVDTNTKKAALVSVPRDLWVPGNHKINASGVSGFGNVGGVIQNITGLPVNYYVAVDFSGFSKLIDTLGGVDVEVPAAFTDSFYPILGQENNTCGKTEAEINALKAQYSDHQLESQFTCRYEKISYDKGPATLNGEAALKFVRSRHGDSDFGRSARQQAILSGIVKKLISLKNINKLDDAIDVISGIVKTDINIGTVKTLLEVFGDPGAYSVKKIQLTTDNVLSEGKSQSGQYILMPKAGNLNFSEVKSYILSNIN